MNYGIVNPLCGKVFEFYYSTFSADPPRDYEKDISPLLASYASFIWETLYKLSQKRNSMILRFSMMLQSRGVSLTTIDFLYNYRKTVCSRTLQRHEDDAILQKRNVIKSLVVRANIGFWFDNYSKFIRHSRLLKGSYDTYSWTTVALLKYPDTISLDVIEGQRVLPRAPFRIEIIHKFVALGTDKLGEVSCPRANSMNTLHTRNITDYFIPINVLDENPGSNDGLRNLLAYFANWTSARRGKFAPFLVDINIYYRSVKRILTGATPLSDWEKFSFVPFLGYWHCFKIAVEKVFCSYLEVLFAPAYSFLWPNKTMVKKPPLCQMENLFSCLLAAWTKIDAQSRLALQAVRDDNTHRNYEFAVNFYDFFEKFGPILAIYKKQLRSNDWTLRMNNIARLFVLLLQFPCNQYLYGVMYQLLSYDYWINHYPRIYELVSRHSDLFNEDLGEVLNGMLSRSNATCYSVQADVAKLSEKFLMLGGFARRRNGTLFGSVKSRKIGPDGNLYDDHPLTRRLVDHIRSVVVSICDNARDFCYATIDANSYKIAAPMAISNTKKVNIFSLSSESLLEKSDAYFASMSRLLSRKPMNLNRENCEDMEVESSEEVDYDALDLEEENQQNVNQVLRIKDHRIVDKNGALSLEFIVEKVGNNFDEWEEYSHFIKNFIDEEILLSYFGPVIPEEIRKLL